MLRPLRRFVAPALILLVVGGGILAGMLGVRVFQVGSNSMQPTLPLGTIILVVPTDELDARDIVTMRVNGGLITHTFHWETMRGELVTKGDANSSPDMFPRAPRKEDVVGVVRFHLLIFAPDFWAGWRGRVLMALSAVWLLLWLTPTKVDSAARRRPQPNLA